MMVCSLLLCPIRFVGIWFMLMLMLKCCEFVEVV
jgi:hypothetical protein